MSKSTPMSAIHTEDGALQTMSNTAAFSSAIVTLPKMLAVRVRKQVVRHWTAQHLVQLIWNVSDIRRSNIA